MTLTPLIFTYTDTVDTYYYINVACPYRVGPEEAAAVEKEETDEASL
jgi:hypothetical protein